MNQFCSIVTTACKIESLNRHRSVSARLQQDTPEKNLKTLQTDHANTHGVGIFEIWRSLAVCQVSARRFPDSCKHGGKQCCSDFVPKQSNENYSPVPNRIFEPLPAKNLKLPSNCDDPRFQREEIPTFRYDNRRHLKGGDWLRFHEGDGMAQSRAQQAMIRRQHMERCCSAKRYFQPPKFHSGKRFIRLAFHTGGQTLQSRHQCYSSSDYCQVYCTPL